MKKQMDPSHILINFDFEEVNAAVLRNAQIWKRGKISLVNRSISVFSPNEFAHLYFHADRVFAFKSIKYPAYREILEYIPKGRASLFWELQSRIYTLAQKFSPNNRVRKYIYSKLYFTPRQLKYLVASGLQEKILNRIRKICDEGGLVDFEYVRVGDYMDCSTFTVVDKHLMKWFQLTFGYLADMIANSDVYVVPKNTSGIQTTECTTLGEYFSSTKPKIVISTRTFKQKATIHNSKTATLTPLVETLLERGFFILNIGTPVMPLDVHNDNYLEVSHSFLIQEEFLVCGAAAACIMTAEAGLFTAFAATNLPLVQYDDEWSETHVGVSLFAARRKAGFQDLDIRSEMASREFVKAAELIKDFSTLPNPASHSAPHFGSIIVDLGEI